MDYLWSPWRYQYVSSTHKTPGCVFCLLLEQDSDEKNHILYRGKLNYIVLNIYPYATGHMLIAPFTHNALLSDASKECSDEMMDLAKKCQAILNQEYRPDGFNLGMNLGRAAGAGVAEHFHLHILPRWIGDVNFTTAVAETRVLPEALETTYLRLKPYFR
ncbi:MAG: HIT domain-containing protein [Acidobacteriota bacterium]